MAAIFVGDLSPNVTEMHLLHRFSAAGPIQSVHVCRDRNDGAPLGYAYINFQQRADAERALDMFNFSLLLGKPMRVMWSRYEPSAQISNKGNIFIKNLDPSINNMALFDTFSIFGRIVSCKVVSHGTGSTSHAYVQFKSEESAELAINKLNGKLLNDYQVTIEHFKSYQQREAEGRKKWDKESERKRVERQTELSQKTEQEAMITRRKMNGRVWAKNPVYNGVAIRKGRSQAQLAHQRVQPSCRSDDTVPEFGTCLNSVPAVQPALEAGSAADTVPGSETSPAVDKNSAEDEDFSSDTSNPEMLLDRRKPKFRRKLTLSMLESVPKEKQLLLAYEYLVPIVQRIQKTLAGKISWMLLEGKTNPEIIELMSNPELLREQVHEMNDILEAAAAGMKLGNWKNIFNKNDKEEKRKRGKNRQQIQ